ncbi:MAG: PilZ domain-containing protein [Treponema sp.]|jgi:hypothetical protein|nr:PilZ domain-containing protein [Treponema sp.]
MFTVVLAVVILVSGAGVLYLFRMGVGGKSWVQFFAKGKDAGFSVKELELLRRLAATSDLEDPSSLFWSQARLDSCIRNLVRSVRLTGGGDQATNDFLSRLYDYRKKIELEKPRIKNGIADTRQIDEGQRLRILVEGQGIFDSRLVKNIGQCLIISWPSSASVPGGFDWKGLKISVYFWREEDAGYVFDAVVEDEVFSRGNASLKISRGDRLFRTQKRRSIRIKTHKPAYLYLLEGETPSDTIEVNPGFKCFVENLSDSGCAVLVGGRPAARSRIKVQFILNNAPVCLSGTVRFLEYNGEKNQSLLHVEADPMSLETRNHILGEVFGVVPDEEEDLPFRLPEEEAEAELEAEAEEVKEEIEMELQEEEEMEEENSAGASAAVESAL